MTRKICTIRARATTIPPAEAIRVDAPQLFRPQIEQHDDEKEQDHDRAGINEHLDYANEVCIERHEESGKSEKGNNQAESARDRVSINDHGGAEDEHEQCEDPEKPGGHV